MAHVGPTATSQMAFMPARLKNKRALQAPLTPEALKLTQGSGGADAVFGSRYRRKRWRSTYQTQFRPSPHQFTLSYGVIWC